MFTSQSTNSFGAPTTCQVLCWALGMRWRTGRKGPCTRQADSLVMETDIRLTVRLASPSLDTVPEQPCQPRALSPEQIQNAFINTLDHKDNEERAQQCSVPRPRSRPGQARRASRAWGAQAATAHCLSIAPDTNQQSMWTLPVYSLGQDRRVTVIQAI